MASSASHGLRYSRKQNALSSAQVVQIDQSFNDRQSRKNSNNSSTSGVENGGIFRRQSAPGARYSRSSRTQTTTTTTSSQRSRSNLAQRVIGINDERGDDNGEKSIDDLNTSSTSTATENMEMSQQHNDDLPVVPIDNSNQNGRTTIKKHELINQYFTKLNTGGYFCKLCGGTKNSTQIHKQVPYSDANLRSHLARKHKLTQVLYPSQRLHYQVKSRVLSGDLKKKLDDALIYAIIKDSRPFGDFRKVGFQHFLQVALPNTNYKGPHRTTIKKRMAALYRVYRKALIDELASVTDIALTADSWASPRRMHFVCITAHYYDKEFGYISKVISFRRFIGRSFALPIRQFIRSELKKLKINNKICSITTDNESNIKLATSTKEFGFRIPCLAHGIHLTVTKGLGRWKKKKKRSSTQITTEEEREEEEEQGGYTNIDDADQIREDDIESDDSGGSDVSDGETINDYSDNENPDYEDTTSEYSTEDEEIPTQQSQHGDHDDNENEHALIPDSKEYIYKLLQRARSLITTIHRSSNLDKYVRDQIFLKQQDSNKRSKEDNTEPVLYNELVLDLQIRWSSTFKMLYRFDMLSSILNNVTFTPKNIDGVESQQVLKLSTLTFSHDDWNWLTGLEFVLNRSEESTRLLSGRTYQTLALGKMIISGLKHFLTHHKSDEPLINHLKTLLLEKFEEYYEKKLCPEAEEAIIIASFLNPTTYFYLQEDDKFIKKAKQLIVLKSKCDKFSSTYPSSSNSTPITQSLSKIIKRPLLAIETFLSKCDAPLPSRLSTPPTIKLFTVQQEIGYYISSVDKETEFQEYWNKNQHYLPILTRLVRHYCIMPITSVASESAFSMAGYIQRKHRSSLSATTLRYSMLLRNLEVHHINSS